MVGGWSHNYGAIFGPLPEGDEENDGVVLSIVFLPSGEEAVVVVDCRKFKEVARVKLPTNVHFSFHSCFTLQ